MARTLKITLAYDGTAFVGWQRQAAGVSIQGLLEDALSRIERTPVAVVGAGRTDAGVHALGQVASATLEHPIEPDALRRALNAVLPRDVRVLEVLDAPAGFHARYGARSKTYQYAIVNAAIVSPFEWRYVWQVTQSLDVDAMARAAARLVGRHDFAAFASAGSAVKTTVRTITTSLLRPALPREPLWASSWVPDAANRDSTRLIYEISGDGFLRQMVRTIMGTLVKIGTLRLDPGAIDAILASRDRRAGGPTAPASGLCLVAVRYEADSEAGVNAPTMEPPGLRPPPHSL
jgi:tRNA pseudouridine38-40 synthase